MQSESIIPAENEFARSHELALPLNHFELRLGAARQTNRIFRRNLLHDNGRNGNAAEENRERDSQGFGEYDEEDAVDWLSRFFQLLWYSSAHFARMLP